MLVTSGYPIMSNTMEPDNYTTMSTTPSYPTMSMTMEPDNYSLSITSSFANMSITMEPENYTTMSVTPIFFNMSITLEPDNYSTISTAHISSTISTTPISSNISIALEANYYPTMSTSPISPTMSFMLEPENTMSLLLVILLIATNSLALLGNGLLILAFIFSSKLRQMDFNLFILNLAVTDVLVAVIDIPMFIVNYIMEHDWVFGEGVCGFWIFFDWGLTFASINTLVVISLNRLWAARWSSNYRRHSTRGTTVMAIVISW